MNCKNICSPVVKKIPSIRWVLIILVAIILPTFATNAAPTHKEEAKKILFIGDSMTGWLSERLNAYGRENGFEVSTIVWDGSTIAKWGNSQHLSSVIQSENPDAVFVSLGMNELFEMNPQAKLGSAMGKIKKAIGNRPILWIGPLSWPGQNKGKVVDEWLGNELGPNSYFSSFSLSVPRQSARNPHPTKEGMKDWMDSVIEWIPQHASIHLPGTRVPTGDQMIRGSKFVYKRINEKL